MQYVPGVPGADGYFDEDVARRYDESVADMFEPARVSAAVEFIAAFAGAGRALELGIGTGRIGLPLAQAGVPVHGIELSRAMVARLRAKPGGEDIPVAIGDFATTTVEGAFSVAYLVFNTIVNLTVAGRAGRVLPQRRGAPRAGWLLHRRGRSCRSSGCSRPARPSARST